MTDYELRDQHMPRFWTGADVGAVMVFANCHYAAFSATISVAAARGLILALTQAAGEAERKEQDALQDAARSTGCCDV